MGYNPCGRRVRHDWVTEHGNFNLVIYFFIYLVIYLFQKPIKEAILLENRHNFLLQQCLDGTWCSSLALASCSESALTTTHPEPSTHPRPPPPPLSHLPGWLHPLADAAWTTARTRRMPSTTPSIWSCLPAMSVLYYFDCDDVALKNFAKYFIHQSCDEREHAEKLMKLQNQ